MGSWGWSVVSRGVLLWVINSNLTALIIWYILYLRAAQSPFFNNYLRPNTYHIFHTNGGCLLAAWTIISTWLDMTNAVTIFRILDKILNSNTWTQSVRYDVWYMHCATKFQLLLSFFSTTCRYLTNDFSTIGFIGIYCLDLYNINYYSYKGVHVCTTDLYSALSISIHA